MSAPPHRPLWFPPCETIENLGSPFHAWRLAAIARYCTNVIPAVALRAPGLRPPPPVRHDACVINIFLEPVRIITISTFPLLRVIFVVSVYHIKTLGDRPVASVFVLTHPPEVASIEEKSRSVEEEQYMRVSSNQSPAHFHVHLRFRLQLACAWC